MTNKPTKVFLAAAAGSGAPGWPTALVLDTMDKNLTASEAIARPRTVPALHSGSQTETGASVQKIGRVNAIVCTRGLPNYPESCTAITDPRGHGYAAVADSPK